MHTMRMHVSIMPMCPALLCAPYVQQPWSSRQAVAAVLGISPAPRSEAAVGTSIDGLGPALEAPNRARTGPSAWRGPRSLLSHYRLLHRLQWMVAALVGVAVVQAAAAMSAAQVPSKLAVVCVWSHWSPHHCSPRRHNQGRRWAASSCATSAACYPHGSSQWGIATATAFGRGLSRAEECGNTTPCPQTHHCVRVKTRRSDHSEGTHG
jgi:hypothetical protein